MNTLFALVISIAMTSGDFQDVVVDIFESEKECHAAAVEQNVNGECYPVDGIVRNDEIPATN